MITEILASVVIAFITWMSWKNFTTKSNIPPGPMGIPIFGYMLFLGNRPHETLNELAKKYGNIYSMYIGNKLFIVLNSYEAIKAAFVKQAEIFHGKVASKYDEKQGEVAGIFEAEGELWRDYRRFSLSTLRNFGFGKLSMEPRIKEEIQCVLEKLQSYNEEPTDIADLLRMSISNVICSMVVGNRYEYTDKDFQGLHKSLNRLMQSLRMINFYTVTPTLMKIPGIAQKLNQGTGIPRAHRVTLLKYMMNLISEKIRTHEPGNEDSYIAAWLTEAAKRGPVAGKNFTNQHLARMVVGLFNAGSDTTTNTLRWALLYLMKHPQVQTRVQNEIDEIVGHERMPSMSDQELMPYTQATLMELHRIISLVPGLVHSNIEETMLEGYYIPKRTVILPNLWAVHHNPDYFPEPEKFKPERFLDADGKVIKEERLIPFSMGKRQCLGEGLARMELFLYFTSMLQKFIFSKPRNVILSFDYDIGVTTNPKPYQVIATFRTPTKTG